jgi:hypothetical protein
MYNTKEEIEEGIKEFGSINSLSRHSGIPRSTLHDRYRKYSEVRNQDIVNRVAETAKSDSDLSVISMEDILKPHDTVGKVIDILSTIPSGKFIQDETLRREVGVGNSRWRFVRGSARLAGYWYQCPDKSLVWSGDKNSIQRLAERMKELE